MDTTDSRWTPRLVPIAAKLLTKKAVGSTPTTDPHPEISAQGDREPRDLLPTTPRFEIASRDRLRPRTDELEALQRIQVRGDVLSSVSGREAVGKRRFSMADEVLDYNHRGDTNLFCNALTSLQSAIGLMTYPRFDIGSIGWDLSVADMYANRADEIAWDLAIKERSDFEKAGFGEEDIRAINAFLHTYNVARQAYDRRRVWAGAQDSLSGDISLVIQELHGSEYALDSLRFADIFEEIRIYLNDTKSGDLKKLCATVSSARILYTSDIDIDVANRNDAMYKNFSNDPDMQINYNACTTIARLCELEAKLLLFDSLSFKRTFTPITRRQVMDLLGYARRAFAIGRQKWLHGYGNFVVAEAVAEYAQHNPLRVFRKLDEACEIFRRTNDKWRMGAVRKIADDLLDASKTLGRPELEVLLFGE
jgi:hypothetical protein